MKPVLWLVEDEPSIADTLVYTLESEGFEVRWFERAEPALQALAQGAPALAILDVGLPDINGFELCRRLLAQAADLPILFLTARSDEVDRLIGLEIGADDYVAKPFSLARSAPGCVPFCAACISSSACSRARSTISALSSSTKTPPSSAITSGRCR